MRVAMYARVSTGEQSCDAQLDVLREYTTRRGLEVAGEYVDNGVNGSRSRRPALDRLLTDARRRRFDLLAVVKLDRIARSVRHLTALAGELEALGIDLVVLDQAIDTSTPTGRLLFHVLGSIAEFERDLIRERTVAGMRAARRRGKRIGRPRAEVDRFELLRGLRAGDSVSALARRLGVSRATTRRLVAELAERVPDSVPKTSATTGAVAAA